MIIRTDGTLSPCFPMYASPLDWGNIDNPKFDDNQLRDMKNSCPLFLDTEPQSGILLR